MSEAEKDAKKKKNEAENSYARLELARRTDIMFRSFCKHDTDPIIDMKKWGFPQLEVVSNPHRALILIDDTSDK